MTPEDKQVLRNAAIEMVDICLASDSTESERDRALNTLVDAVHPARVMRIVGEDRLEFQDRLDRVGSRVLAGLISTCPPAYLAVNDDRQLRLAADAVRFAFAFVAEVDARVEDVFPADDVDPISDLCE